jgi:hypothetical protein
MIEGTRHIRTRDASTQQPTPDHPKNQEKSAELLTRHKSIDPAYSWVRMLCQLG